MSGPLYPNQPLIEVATEVRFEGDLKVEEVRPKFQETVREQYPRLMVSGAQEGIAPSLQPIRFEDDNKRSGIQLAINSFSYFSREYPGHQTFLKEVADKLTIFIDLLGTVKVTRVGWRYINALPFARLQNNLLPLSRFFDENKFFGNALGDAFEDLSCFVATQNADKRLNIKLESAKSTQDPEADILILDIDAFSQYSPSEVMTAPAIVENIKHVHDAAYDAFETMITKTYRAFLRGEETYADKPSN